MPWTEYLWHFDHFLRGGYDFELGLLSLVSIFCLAVVLVQQGRLSLAVALALRCWSFLLRRSIRLFLEGSAGWSHTSLPFHCEVPLSECIPCHFGSDPLVRRRGEHSFEFSDPCDSNPDE